MRYRPNHIGSQLPNCRAEVRCCQRDHSRLRSQAFKWVAFLCGYSLCGIVAVTCLLTGHLGLFSISGRQLHQSILSTGHSLNICRIIAGPPPGAFGGNSVATSKRGNSPSFGPARGLLFRLRVLLQTAHSPVFETNQRVMNRAVDCRRWKNSPFNSPLISKCAQHLNEEPRKERSHRSRSNFFPTAWPGRRIPPPARQVSGRIH